MAHVKNFSEFSSSIDETMDMMFFPGDTDYVTSMGKTYAEAAKVLKDKASEFTEKLGDSLKITRPQAKISLETIKKAIGMDPLKATADDIKEYILSVYGNMLKSPVHTTVTEATMEVPKNLQTIASKLKSSPEFKALQKELKSNPEDAEKIAAAVTEMEEATTYYDSSDIGPRSTGEITKKEYWIRKLISYGVSAIAVGLISSLMAGITGASPVETIQAILIGMGMGTLIPGLLADTTYRKNEAFADRYDATDPYGEEGMETPLKDVKGGAVQKIGAVLQKLFGINLLTFGTLGTLLTWLLGSTVNPGWSMVASIIAFVVVHIIRKLAAMASGK